MKKLIVTSCSCMLTTIFRATFLAMDAQATAVATAITLLSVVAAGVYSYVRNAK